jgi:hypothetical protein
LAAAEHDANRYILVQRNYVYGEFTRPKSKKARRVDLSRQLRAVLLELRDQCLVKAFLCGKTSVSDDHSSIQVTADVYGHLLPGANVDSINKLDTPLSPQRSATRRSLTRVMLLKKERNSFRTLVPAERIELSA